MGSRRCGGEDREADAIIGGVRAHLNPITAGRALVAVQRLCRVSLSEVSGGLYCLEKGSDTVGEL